ncbi:hypothetical protein [Streptomyces sp. NBC_00996]|uniref:hypothetical protein n=1 Tax=Streptomyces sp. NBC_00996 TaxID=2903710 RepID=UPI00386DF1B6|nr:hypothetical protein OG390_05260 [Streptomyces sp. NBC_00996]
MSKVISRDVSDGAVGVVLTVGFGAEERVGGVVCLVGFTPVGGGLVAGGDDGEAVDSAVADLVGDALGDGVEVP